MTWIQKEDWASAAAGVLLGSGVWLGYAFVVSVGQADSTVKASIIGGAVAVATLVVTVLRERQRQFREIHRDKKIEVYSKFYDELFSILRSSKDEKERSKSPGETKQELRKLLDRWFDMSRGIMFYGSPEVVLTFSAFRLGAAEDPPVGVTAARIGRVLLEMRMDIGLSNRGLNELNIHQIYLNEDATKLGAMT